jgi:hypothetical protein
MLTRPVGFYRPPGWPGVRVTKEACFGNGLNLFRLKNRIIPKNQEELLDIENSGRISYVQKIFTDEGLQA